MKRILVYCLKESEWYNYCKSIMDLANNSITLYLEVREDSMIEHRSNSTYIKVTPENFDNLPLYVKVGYNDKVYLCNEDEWEAQSMLNKMGRGL